mgnify:FL=1|tara:strand:- start:254 stop:1135 length:882 start_codon:yes stop_codon:yes gene_type:complete
MKRDAFLENILTRFVKNLEDHGKDWVKPWVGSSNLQSPINGATGYAYAGINWFNLIMTADARGYTSNRWGSYKQWTSIGRKVPKGNGSYVFYYGKGYDKDNEKAYSFGKITPVWNESQLPDYVPPPAPTKKNLVVQHQDCEAFVQMVNANVEYGGSRACYTPATDTINMPNADAFVDTPDATATQSFYSTLLHEHVHWTGHESRLNRLKSKGKFTSDYAYEELIAELGSVILAVQLGLEVQPTPDHAKYINTWLTGLKDEPRALVRAMSDASKAVACLEAEKRKNLMATLAAE